MIQLFSSVGLWRQQLRPTARVHGIIREGGTAANIIPDRTSAWFMLRSDDQDYYEEMKVQFSKMAEAAALATGTTVEVTYSGGATTMRNNLALAERFRANMAAYGIEDMGDDPNAGSTDMANVSWVCPTIHPDLAICDEGVAGHSTAFRDAAVDATRRRDDAAGGDADRADRRRPLPRPGAGRARMGGVPGRLSRSRGVPSPRRAPLDAGSRTGGAPDRDGLPHAARTSDRLRLRRITWPSAPTTPTSPS